MAGGNSGLLPKHPAEGNIGWGKIRVQVQKRKECLRNANRAPLPGQKEIARRLVWPNYHGAGSEGQDRKG